MHASTSDLFMETLDPSSRHRYERNGRWIDAEHRVEQIAVRYGEPVEIDIVRTRHGPLLGSVLPDAPELRAYAVRWSGAAPRSGIEALLAVQRAGDWEHFRAALRRYPAPAASFLFAHRGGRIGSQVAGQLPVRAIETGLLPVTGNSRYYDWRGFTPFDDLPSRSGTELPWLVVSTHPDAGLFKTPVNWLWRSGGAPERTVELIGERESLDLDALLAIERDTRSTRAPRVISRLLAATDHVEGAAARVRAILIDWDGDTGVHSIGASVYHAFRQILTRRVVEARFGGRVELADLVSAREPVPGALLARYLERIPADQRRPVVEQTLRETWDWLGQSVSANPRRWQWGELHRVRASHSFERMGSWIERIFGRWLGRGPYPAPGDADSVWTMHHATLPVREVGVGPVLRYAVDLADVDHARFGLAGGQSGHPGTAHYDDALADWLAGRPRPLWMNAADFERLAQGVWELRPSAGGPHP